MRQKFDSYDDYRQVVDGVINRCELAQEKLRSELLKIIAWADKNNIPQYKLPRDTEELCNLDALYLNDLKLTHLPDWIGKLSQLTTLDVSFNQLTHLPDWIGKLSQLTKLDVYSNQLTHLPDSIGKLSQLTELHVSFNQLTHLPDSIGNLTNLRELNIRDNPLVVRYNLDGETVYTNDIINEIKAFESKREEEERVRQQMLKRIELEKAQEDAKIINRIKRFFNRIKRFFS